MWVRLPKDKVVAEQRHRSRRRWLSVPRLALCLFVSLVVSTLAVLLGGPPGPLESPHWPSATEVATVVGLTLVFGALIYVWVSWQGETTSWICPRCRKVSASHKVQGCSCGEPLEEFWKWEWKDDA